MHMFAAAPGNQGIESCSRLGARGHGDHHLVLLPGGSLILGILPAVAAASGQRTAQAGSRQTQAGNFEEVTARKTRLHSRHSVNALHGSSLSAAHRMRRDHAPGMSAGVTFS